MGLAELPRGFLRRFEPLATAKKLPVLALFFLEGEGEGEGDGEGVGEGSVFFP